MIPDLTFEILAACAGIMLVAGLVHGTLGLGFPVVSTPLIALMLDVRSAILVTLLPTVAVNVVSIARGGRWEESIGRHWPLSAFALLGALLGSHLLATSDPEPFRLALAGLVLLYLGVTRIERFGMPWIRSRPRLAMLVFGLVGGLSAGSTNVMVPVLIIYALEIGLEKTAMVQVFNLCFLAGKISQILIFGLTGLLSAAVLMRTAPLAVVSVLALLAGMSIRDRLGTEVFRRLVRGLLLVLAVLLIGQYLGGRYA